MTSPKKTYSIFIGSAIVILAFILCVIILAVFSVLAARREWSAAMEVSQKVTQYYAADDQAQQILQGANQNLKAAWESSDGDIAIYLQAASDGLQFCTGMPFSVNEDRIFFQVPLDENQLLDVELQIIPPDEDGHYYKILSWQTSTATTE